MTSGSIRRLASNEAQAPIIPFSIMESPQMAVFTHEVEVLDPIGLHARPASQIVKLVKESELDVQIGRPGEEFVKAKSALMLMSLKIKTGEKLTLTVETDDEAVASDIASQIQDFLKG
jgi:phosphotransferase system HPr (HPr) family protein